MLILKRVRNWIRANVVYRSFVGLEWRKCRNAKTLVRLGQAVGPEAIRELHNRLVAIAQQRQVVRGRKMRVDIPVDVATLCYTSLSL